MTPLSTGHAAPAARALLDGCRVVLVEPSHVGNIGSAARALRTMGLADLVVVAPRDPGYRDDPRAVALAGGGAGVLAASRLAASLQAAVADCAIVIAVSAEPREFGPVAGRPDEIAAAAVRALSGGQAERVAFVFGTERTGLSVSEMGLCRWLLSIPADPGYSSLNLAQAVQIVAFSIRQAALAASPDPVVPGGERRPGDALADHAALEGLYAHLERALVAVGHLDPARPKRMMPRLRRLFARAGLERADVDLLRGFCTRIERAVAAAAR